MSLKEPKANGRDTVRKLRLELCALQAELHDARDLLAQTAEIAARSECRRHEALKERDGARRLLKAVWEAATDDRVAFFERLGLLRPLVPRVVEELAALEASKESQE